MEWVNNTIIPDDMLDRFNICKLFPDDIEGIYRTFLKQTDYIPNKIIEAQFLNESLAQDYSDVLEMRKQVRQLL